MFSLTRGNDDGLIPEFEEEDLNLNLTLTQLTSEDNAVEEEKSNLMLAQVAVEDQPKVSNNFTLPFIGQNVIISRKTGQMQQAIVTEVLQTNNDLIQQNNNIVVNVEWTENDGCIKGKSIEVSKLSYYNEPINTTPEINNKQVSNIASINGGSKINLITTPQPSTSTNSCNNLENTSEPNTTPQPSTSTDSSNRDNGNIENKTVCPICSFSFKNERGLKTHVAKKHPVEANRLKLNNLLNNNKLSDCNLNENENNQIDIWANKFKAFLSLNTDQFKREDIDQTVNDFLEFLKEANKDLPGPKHPAARYYKMRRKNKDSKSTKGNSKSSNPQRANKASREKRAQQYQYEVAQYNYYNRRKKVVNNVMNSDQPKQCPVNINQVEEHYKAVFEEQNNIERDNYENKDSKPNIISVKLSDIHKAVKSTSLDTSPGPDGVLIRTIKALNIYHIIKSIIDLILKFSYVPEPLRRGRTVLIHKGKGDVNDLSSWRPITMYSILRRIIEKVLDAELRRQISFHPSQRGFVKGLPGCHVNARLMNAVLQDAKRKKKTAVVVFLDVTGAFDNVGHRHVIKTLKSNGVSSDLIDSIESLLCNNTIKVSLGLNETAPISVYRGVPQGGPMSSTLFNIAIDHIFKEFCDPQIANSLGYELSENKDRLVLTGFADDQAITACDMVAAERLIDGIQRRLSEIGLSVNPQKSTAFVVIDGKLDERVLRLEDGSEIESVGEDETVKYLGCTFSGELVCNQDSIRKLHDNLNKLTTSDLLKPDQKLNILNQYIFPALTYPLQTAPLTKLPQSLLDGIDVIIRRSTKAIIGLPANTTTAMLYSPRRFRGLGILRCTWEAPLQHLSIAQKLSTVPDTLFQDIFNYDDEVTECLKRLDIEIQSNENINVKKIRQQLREKSFDEWSKCKWQGVGVQHFKDYPSGNKYIWDRKVLTGSEWTNSIKLNVNYAPLRAVPGNGNQSTGDVGTLCRKCGRENETPAHVLGKCPYNMLLVTRRHHNVKHKISEVLKEKKYICYDEVYAIDSEGSSRFSDIIAFHPDNKTALIIDPTIRFETNDLDQADKVHDEKKNIYEKCIDYYKEMFRTSHGDRNYIVHGLWFGSRGTISAKSKKFFDEIGTDQNFLRLLAENIILDSLGIINHHIYS